MMMRMKPFRHRVARFAPLRLLLLALIASMAAQRPAGAETLTVMTSGAFRAALDKLSVAYEKKTGNAVVIVQGPSMGTDPAAIPARLTRGEKADIVILARSALDQLAADGFVTAADETDLGVSEIAMAVKTGARVPDIATVASFKRTLLSATSIAYSDSASGVYIKTELWKKLGLENQLAPKSRMIQATPVGEIVAKGEAQIGFQQMSELLPVKDIHIVGLIPEALQKATIFSAGRLVHAQHPAEARKLVSFLASPEVFGVIRASGMEPAQAPAK
jgi:molybdate transport system substrate-binding protein